MPISYSTTMPAPIKLPAVLPSIKGQKSRSRYESDEAKLLLEFNGIDSLEALGALLDKSVHQHKSRSVSRVILPAPDGRAVEAFVKMNWGLRPVVPRIRDF